MCGVGFGKVLVEEEKNNLCNNCKYFVYDCASVKVEFGNVRDNIIKCDIYEIKNIIGAEKI